MPAVSFIQTIFVMVMNTVTDFYLMSIPLPASSIPILTSATYLAASR